MVNKCYGNVSEVHHKKEKKTCVRSHMHTYTHTEKHVLDKEKYQSQLNVVLLIGSHIAASVLTAVLFSLCNAHVVCKDKEGIEELGDAVISRIFPNCSN